MLTIYLGGLERHKSSIPVKRAEYVLLGPELEQLAKRSGAGLLGGGGSCLIVCPI